MSDELELLYDRLFELVRGVLRYNGVDKDKRDYYFDQLDQAVNNITKYKEENYWNDTI